MSERAFLDTLDAWRAVPTPSIAEEAEAWLASEGGGRKSGPLPGIYGGESHGGVQTERALLIELLHDRLATHREFARSGLWKEPARVRITLEERFGALAASWRADTLLESSATRMAMHKAYQQIIGLGVRAVPLILAELQREPNYWFWALSAITGEDPAAGEETLAGATARWLDWGRERGYLA